MDFKGPSFWFYSDSSDIIQNNSTNYFKIPVLFQNRHWLSNSFTTSSYSIGTVSQCVNYTRWIRLPLKLCLHIFDNTCSHSKACYPHIWVPELPLKNMFHTYSTWVNQLWLPLNSTFRSNHWSIINSNLIQTIVLH